MKQELSADKKTKYLEKIKEAIKNPKYSIFIVFGIPFILALLGALFEPFFLFIALIGPIVALTYYAYYTGNKLSSAILGLLIFPLMFFYVEPIDRILDFRFGQLGRYFEWSYMLNIVGDFWKYSFVHSLIGFLVAFRKKAYLAIALLLFILQFIEFISHID